MSDLKKHTFRITLKQEKFVKQQAKKSGGVSAFIRDLISKEMKK